MANQAQLDELKARIASIAEQRDDCAKTSRRPSVHKASKGASSTSEEFDPDDAQAAYLKALALLNVSDRSAHALEARLRKAGYSDAASSEAVDRCRRCGIIDDVRYADALVRSRISQGKGAAGIERELRENNIDPYALEGWPEAYFSADEELDRARAFLKRHPVRSKNIRDAAYRKLVTKGYSSSVAASAAREWASEHSLSHD